jgi:hypothetical protein
MYILECKRERIPCTSLPPCSTWSRELLACIGLGSPRASEKRIIHIFTCFTDFIRLDLAYWQPDDRNPICALYFAASNPERQGEPLVQNLLINMGPKHLY